MSARSRASAAILLALVVFAAACRGELRFDDAIDAAVSRDASAARDFGACGADSECGLASLHCEIGSGRCVACTEHVHCGGATPRCDPVLFRCVGCISADDCAAPRTCDPATRSCLVPCREDDDDCPTDTRCNERTRRCAACAETSHCTKIRAGLTCDESTGRCIACRRDESCGGGRCDTFLGRCVECLAASDCPKERAICDLALGSCVGSR